MRTERDALLVQHGECQLQLEAQKDVSRELSEQLADVQQQLKQAMQPHARREYTPRDTKLELSALGVDESVSNRRAVQPKRLVEMFEQVVSDI